MMEMLILVFGAMGVGFFLIFLLAVSDKKRASQNPPGQVETPTITQPQFEKACVQVIEGMKLEISEISRSGDNRLDIFARNPVPIIGGDLLIHCLYTDPRQVITASQILEVSNMVVQDRLTKAIFITTGKFTNEIPAIGELAPLEFIDGIRLKGLMEKYRVVVL